MVTRKKVRSEKYEPRLTLKPEVEFDDLIGLALSGNKTQKKTATKAKRATGKKKK